MGNVPNFGTIPKYLGPFPNMGVGLNLGLLPRSLNYHSRFRKSILNVSGYVLALRDLKISVLKCVSMLSQNLGIPKVGKQIGDSLNL